VAIPINPAYDGGQDSSPVRLASASCCSMILTPCANCSGVRWPISRHHTRNSIVSAPDASRTLKSADALPR
jgi:hypothetical protein